MQTINIEMIYDYNFMGLSNTAARGDALSLNLNLTNPNIKAFDWFFGQKYCLKITKLFFLINH